MDEDELELNIDLPDPAAPGRRSQPGLQNARDPAALPALLAATPARIAVGRAGPRPRTASWLRFQADHAVTQDTLLREVDPDLLEELDLFSVQTQVAGGKAQYLLRPDLGRRLDEQARQMILEQCPPNPDLQICVGDGLSAAAIETNLPIILPAIRLAAASAGLTLGRPFFIRYCRVGVLNDIGDLLRSQAVVLLIGERPGLGRAESMSAYMAYRPKSGDSDANRQVLCNIYEGGLDPREAGAIIVRMVLEMIQRGYSGVRPERS